MNSNILNGHGALCSLYKAHVPGSHGLSGDTLFNAGDFRSEGDSPAFLHNILTGLRNMESPDYGGWGGRYIKVRENTWLDPVPFEGYQYPEGRWFTRTAWGRNYMREVFPDGQDQMEVYFRPLSRWTDVMQNDFAARADWCVKSFEEANHPPVVSLSNALNITANPGEKLMLDATNSYDPDGDELTFRWWQYEEADTYLTTIDLVDPKKQEIEITVPTDIKPRETIHIICEVRDDGMPNLTRYQRVIITGK